MFLLEDLSIGDTPIIKTPIYFFASLFILSREKRIRRLCSKQERTGQTDNQSLTNYLHAGELVSIFMLRDAGTSLAGRV